MRRYRFVAAALFAAGALTVQADNISFSTFVTSSSIAAAEVQHQTIAFNFAGNKFVGSVYSGVNNNQLYQTDLSGGAVSKFGDPIPSAGGEVVVGASLGQGGFAKGDIYAGAENSGKIWHFANSGGTPTLFATVPSGVVRQIFFDPGSSFGGDMIVTTTAGNIYRIPVVVRLARWQASARIRRVSTSPRRPGDLLLAICW